MTEEQRALLTRINSYAENVLGDIDPQKVPVSAQLKKLTPIMQEIADEKHMSLEDLFILYMDLQSEASCASAKAASSCSFCTPFSAGLTALK